MQWCTVFYFGNGSKQIIIDYNKWKTHHPMENLSSHDYFGSLMTDVNEGESSLMGDRRVTTREQNENCIDAASALLKFCLNSASALLQFCISPALILLQPCFNSPSAPLQPCFNPASTLLQPCINSASASTTSIRSWKTAHFS